MSITYTCGISQADVCEWRLCTSSENTLLQATPPLGVPFVRVAVIVMERQDHVPEVHGVIPILLLPEST